MKYKRLYLFPISVFIAALVMRIVILAYILNYLRHHAYRPAVIKNLMNFWTILWPLVFIAEIFIYSPIRKKIYKRSWVLVHSWCSLVGFIIVPLLYNFSPLIFGRYFFTAGIDRILIGRKVVFWLLIIAGHLFFILTIAKAYQAKEVISDETPGLLDEFVS